ncbi:thrombomodulin-like [Myripristis murdjan]|uniref:thrombomodulin-like n=1 Tax=Myripristis murdjan TaxID=586833 RepID=UPI001176482C|nr:thrombomodulin-like [Myripristis murdjan]
MRPATQALLLCAAVLWRLGEAAVSRRELCAGSKCYAVFQESRDFPGAQKSCEDFGGHLLTLQSLRTQEILSTLLDGLGGRYWIGLQLQDGRCPDRASQLFGYTWVVGDGATDSTSWSRFNTDCSLECVSVSEEGNSTWWQQSCRDKLQGYLCQYSFQEPCARFPVNEDVNVDYTTATGFSANDWEVFPQGSIVVLQQTDAKHLTSKYICFSSNWAQAPWNCGVMKGGCEHKCVSQNRQHSCTCPTGQPLHANKITCEEDPCAGCAHKCENEGDTYACRCDPGYTLAADRKGCVDVDECKNERSCSDENRECLNSPGGFQCPCKEGFTEVAGECVNSEICDKCEHMRCNISNGVFKCECRKGFKVSNKDPTKCEMHCTEQDCPARCIPNSESGGEPQCYCPNGYIQDRRNATYICTDIDECENERPCEHTCLNTLGSYECFCDEGYELQEAYRCVSTEEGSGSTPPYHDSTPVAVQPTAVPAYVKAGSVLGITVFMALSVALLYFVVRNALKRCGKLELASLKGPDVDIFYLQQVTTEKYKRFSFDKQWKNDSQKL